MEMLGLPVDRSSRALSTPPPAQLDFAKIRDPSSISPDIMEITPFNYPMHLATRVNKAQSKANMEGFMRLADGGISTDLLRVSELLKRPDDDKPESDAEH